jgi:hypothetical protein
MKRTELIGKIRKEARKAKVEWELVRQGARHEIWRLGDLQVSIPRHREVNELTAQGILRDTEDELGEGWW